MPLIGGATHRTFVLMLSCIALMGCSATAEAAFPGANGRIAFDALTPAETRDIFSLDLATGAQANLTNTSSVDDQQPAWSPDGTKIAFDSAGHIVVMDADGSSPQALTSGTSTDQQPSWSPDGTKIAFARFGDTGGGDIFVVNADGSGAPEQITNYGAQGGSAQAPAWSPGGATIAYEAILPPSENYQIFLISADGSGAPTAITDGSTDAGEPDWSPDGKQLAYQSVVSLNGGLPQHDIFIANADGSAARDITHDPAEDLQPDWSPDGTEVAFVSDRSGVGNIWAAPATGGPATQLSMSTFSEGNPDWQPMPQPALPTRGHGRHQRHHHHHPGQHDRGPHPTR